MNNGSHYVDLTKKTWIQTLDGQAIHFIKENPPEVFTLDAVIQGIFGESRFCDQINIPGWKVGHHCLCVGQWLRRKWPKEDMLHLQGFAHDAQEFATRDISTPLKNAVPGFKVVEDKLQRELFDAWGIDYPLDDRVHLADGIFCRLEAESGFKIIVDNWTHYLPELDSDAIEIMHGMAWRSPEVMHGRRELYRTLVTALRRRVGK